MDQDLLFEVGTEEMPAGELPAALGAYRAAAVALFEEARLSFRSLRIYATPRRLTLLVEGLAHRQGDLTRQVIGPARAVAFDKEGRPTKAALGFARSQGVTPQELRTVQTERGEYVAVRVEEKGRPAVEILPVLLPRLVLSIPFGKQMRWGEADLRFVRPIRWLCCLYGAAVVPVRIGTVKAGSLTYGHRFLSPGPFAIPGAGEYLSLLEAQRVIADPERRKAVIRKQVEETAAGLGGRAVIEEELLEQVTHMVEWPVAVAGELDPTYLAMPREVVVTPMQKHQRYFPVQREDGQLLAWFITISNTETPDPSVVRKGNERVLRARLADADFYFREDREVPLSDRLPQLRGVTFQERLGTLYEKTERVMALARYLAGLIAPTRRFFVERAAELAKADLVTGVVREFPELQGIMGREYARLSKEPVEVAQAIGEQYLPRSAGDPIPRSLEGAILSVSDRIDTIVGCLAAGFIPTGSEDPYALRRQAFGAISIMLDFPLHILGLLPGLVDHALVQVAPKIGLGTALEAKPIRERIMEFFRGRLETAMQERGIQADVVEAILAEGFDDPYGALVRARALTEFRGRPDFEALLITFKRVVNILPDGFRGEVDRSRFEDDVERQLHARVEAERGAIEAALASEAYQQALERIAGLRPLVDQFFNTVMVMVDDPALRANRLALLHSIARLLLPIADLRKLSVG